MKTKKLFASVIAVAGLFTCMAVSSASAWTLHNCGSISYSSSKSFVDSSNSNANVNSCSYTYNSGNARVWLSAIENRYTKPRCYISGEKTGGGWTYFADGRDSISANPKVKNVWGRMYNKVDFETGSLCSRLSTY